ncbi:cation:proton antiporter [Gordonia sp. (in: high G+C Gram-positive bacteria)]|uniref:cation:proton antiporter n=2 Tax=Gordonia TaxID=2053 RepID=UPI003527D05E
MAESLVIMVVALLSIAATTVIGPKVGLAAPLLLVAIGVGASFVPALRDVEIDPEWILEGLLPPLLYSSAVSMPAMNFRREFRAISGLSVVLVVASALLLGVFFMLVIPDLGFAWGVALGAIISPTDAVATSIVKQTSVSKRVVAILDGESLLNDASALVVLRTAIVATAASFSFWGALGTFAWSVLVAAVVGALVGVGNLWVRKFIAAAPVNTVVSFTVPFIAAVPAELAGGSGLVAAVVAGLVTGVGAPRVLSPRNRLSDTQNWHTMELVLEGVVFLTMGLQIKHIVESVERDHAGVGTALVIAVAALALTLVIRAAYFAPALGVIARRARRYARAQPRFESLQEKLSTPEGRARTAEKFEATRGRSLSEKRLDKFATRVTRGLADIDYFLREPLGWREGTTVVWAGMRGAVTVAAAQTLPADTPQRSMLILVAYAVAVASLTVQGGTIGPLLAMIAPKDDGSRAAQDAAERERLLQLIRDAAEAVPEPEPPAGDDRQAEFELALRHRIAVLDAQRVALLDARDDGTFDADILEEALMNVDASQIAIELRGRHVE